MMIYLTSVQYKDIPKLLFKVGHTQKKFHERFDDPQYKSFKFERKDHIWFSRPVWLEAKNLAIKIETEIISPFKKRSDFIIEDYLGIERGALNLAEGGKPLSGITEMFVVDSHEKEVELYDRFSYYKSLYHNK